MLVFYTEDVSLTIDIILRYMVLYLWLKGRFLQRAIAGRAVVLRGLLQSGTWSYYSSGRYFFWRVLVSIV